MDPWIVLAHPDPETGTVLYYAYNQETGASSDTFASRAEAAAHAADLNGAGLGSAPTGAGAGAALEQFQEQERAAQEAKLAQQRLATQLGMPLGMLDAEGKEIEDNGTVQGALAVRAGIQDRMNNLGRLPLAQKVDAFGQPTDQSQAATADMWRRALSTLKDSWGKEVQARIKTQDALLSSAASRARAEAAARRGAGTGNALGYAQIAAATARAEAAAQQQREEFNIKRQDEIAAQREARRRYIAQLEDQLLQRRLAVAQQAPPNLPYPPGFEPGGVLAGVARQIGAPYAPVQTGSLTSQVDFGPTMQAIADYRNAPDYPEPQQVP